MATTIGRMAVVLTSDTTRFDAGFQKAGATVQNFTRQVRGGSLSLGAMPQAANVARAAMTGLTGSVGGLAAGLAGPVGLVVAAMFVIRKLKELAQASMSAATEVEGVRVTLETRLAKTLAAQGKDLKVAGDELKKILAEQQSQFKQLITPAGRFLNELRARGNTNINAALKELNRLSGTAAAGDQKSRFTLAGRQLTVGELEKFVKAHEDAQKAAAEAQQKMLESFRNFQDKMRATAERLNTSLRSPVEVFADTMNELRSVFQLGGLSPERLTSGIEQAKKELLAASDVARRFREVAAPPLVGAVDRNTMSGAQEIARLRADQRAEVKAIERLEKIEQAELEVLKNGFDALKKLKPINLHQGNF